MDYLIFGTIGIAVGIAGAMLGIGGGVVIVPLLSFVFGCTPQQAIGTSMFVVLLNGLSGAFGYLRQKKVFLDAAWKFSLATVPGAFLGSYVSEYLKGKLFFLVFGIFFFCFSIHMYRKAGKQPASDEPAVASDVPKNYNWKLGVATSTIVGFLASILGIGGGVIHVPMMTYLLHFPVKVAIATSTAILAISAVVGVISHSMLGHIIWSTAVSIGVGASIGAQIGVHIAAKTKSKLLMRATSFLVMATALKFLFNSF